MTWTRLSIATASLLLSVCVICYAWSTNDAAAAAGAAGSQQQEQQPQMLMILGKTNQEAVALSAAATLAMAAPSVSLNAAVDFNGSYADPNHPNCKRIIRVIPESITTTSTTNALLSGTDGNPGCPADGSGDAWTLIGQIYDDVGAGTTTIVVDFSPKGGPANLKGVYHHYGGDDHDGGSDMIEWPDGNAWTKKKTSTSTASAAGSS